LRALLLAPHRLALAGTPARPAPVLRRTSTRAFAPELLTPPQVAPSAAGPLFSSSLSDPRSARQPSAPSAQAFRIPPAFPASANPRSPPTVSAVRRPLNARRRTPHALRKQRGHVGNCSQHLGLSAVRLPRIVCTVSSSRAGPASTPARRQRSAATQSRITPLPQTSAPTL
jgi:hypothetical protein